ncbi:MAG: GTP-binding protein [Candidatus Methanospirare jalkutatii]|nr:MAG: GTP-binding protein [Candidatus Methanospirare jalkutatii]
MQGGERRKQKRRERQEGQERQERQKGGKGAGILEEIQRLEEEIRKTPYNKATEHHIGRLKAKIARLRSELERKRSASARGSGGTATAAIRKEGDATVVLVGYPSVGKSTLLNALTNASSAVADYDFTTVRVVPGMLSHKGAEIQVLDAPGLVEGASAGRGRGREVLSVVRNADLLLLVTDVFRTDMHALLNELVNAGIRLNEKPPAVKIVRKERGGISIFAPNSLLIDEKTVRSILQEYRMHNADVFITDENITIERFIDAIEGNRRYIPAIIAVNKIDLCGCGGEIESSIQEMREDLCRSGFFFEASDIIPISAKEGANIEALKDAIFNKLRFLRIYLKPPGKREAEKEPMILREGATVGDVCDKIHRELRKKFKYARIWGKSVKYEGQRVGLEHKLCDGDVVSIFAGR